MQAGRFDCTDTTPALTDLKFYVADVALIDTAGDGAAARRSKSLPPWQNASVALVDLETGDGRCADGNDRRQCPSIVGSVPARRL